VLKTSRSICYALRLTLRAQPRSKISNQDIARNSFDHSNALADDTAAGLDGGALVSTM
jgi:hypothetical protein